MPTRTISTTAEELIPANALRRSMVIQNQSTTDAAFVKKEKFGASVSSTDHDFRIGAGETVTFSLEDDGQEELQARYTIVAAAATPRISIFETLGAPVPLEFRQ